MNTITENARVTGLFFNRAYTGTVSMVQVYPSSPDVTHYFVTLDDTSILFPNVVIKDPPIGQSKTTIQPLIPLPIGPYTAADNDYDYTADNNVYPRDTIETLVDRAEESISMTDMFGIIEREVITSYVDGQLQVCITATLDRVQVKAFNAGACRIPGITACTLDTFAPYSDDNTAFILRFNPSINANRCESIRREVRSFAHTFLENLLPTPVQASLF